jgi:hypothetical protein
MKGRDLAMGVGLVLVLASVLAMTAAAQDQFINCRKLADGIKITVDGDPGDWPLAAFGDPAEWPDMPEDFQFNDGSAQSRIDNGFERGNLKTGDHFLWNPAKVLVNSGGSASFQMEDDPKTGEVDFAATTYIAWDNQNFYILNVVKDSLIGLEHGQGGSEVGRLGGQPAYTNDGIELWFDNDNDRWPENIQNDPSSEFDLQLDVDIDDVLLKEFDIENTMDNGLPVELAIFRSALNTDDDAELEILNKIPHTAKIASDRKSYVQEIAIPWDVFPSFDNKEPIGFNVNWCDWDDAVFMLCRWHQFNESDLAYFAEMRWTSDKPLGAVSVYDWSIH